MQGQPLDPSLRHGVLAYSNWQWAVRCQSESFPSLVAGVQACRAAWARLPECLATETVARRPRDSRRKRAYNPDYLDLVHPLPI